MESEYSITEVPAPEVPGIYTCVVPGDKYLATVKVDYHGGNYLNFWHPNKERYSASSPNIRWFELK